MTISLVAINQSKSQNGLTVKIVTAPAITSLPPTAAPAATNNQPITVIVTEEVILAQLPHMVAEYYVEN